MIEVIGLGGPRLTLVLLPGLLASGIGSLVSLGLGAWTGLSSSAYALGQIEGLGKFPRPDIADFGWTIALALAVALACVVIVGAGRRTVPVIARRRFILLPLLGLIIAGLAIAFHEAAGKPFQEVLFSGQDSMATVASKAGTWSLGALALLVVFKGIAYTLSIGGFRGGPTFPAIFLGAVAGVMAGQLPGFAVTPGVAVGIAAAIAAVLRLPLSAIVFATLLTVGSGAGSGPLVIVGTIVAFMVSHLLLKPPRVRPRRRLRLRTGNRRSAVRSPVPRSRRSRQRCRGSPPRRLPRRVFLRSPPGSSQWRSNGLQRLILRLPWLP